MYQEVCAKQINKRKYRISIIFKLRKQWRDVIGSSLSLLVRPSVRVRVGGARTLTTSQRGLISDRSTSVRGSSFRLTGFYTSIYISSDKLLGRLYVKVQLTFD